MIRGESQAFRSYYLEMAISETSAPDLRQAVLDRYVQDGGLGTFSEVKQATHIHNLLPLVRDVPRDAPILEIGPGLGELLECLRTAQFRQIEACDQSPEIIEACARRGFTVHAITSIPDFLATQTGRYGAVFMIDVLEHLTKTEAFEALRAIVKALRPGGHVIIQVPNMQSPFASTNLYWDITHEVGYTEFSLRQLCSSAGFVDVRLSAYDYPPVGLYRVRRVLRSALYLVVKSILLVDQWNRGSIFTPNLIARASRPR
jgi:2-polyprenyl-3-methyl-5-hydroxy-6-metoxy-1,4-benzoquinol methylase